MKSEKQKLDTVELARVNAYLARKQHLLPGARSSDLLQVTRDIVALHATNPTGPHLSLWARVPDFRRQALDDALYNRRDLSRLLCMRTTLHVVPSDEMPCFQNAYGERVLPPEFRDWSFMFTQAGLCGEEQADELMERLHRQVLDVLEERGPSTVRQIAQAVPELAVKVRHSAGKSYAGEFSIGSRLVPAMCTQGLLIRARARGTWRSNLHEYAALDAWLPGLDLGSMTPEEARSWLVRRYLSAFGPATVDDVQWWTGFTKGETQAALAKWDGDLLETTIDGLGGDYLLLLDDARRLQGSIPPAAPYVFLLPSLDPYIMGYHDRRRFLAPEHRTKVFDRAGNALPTVWVDGRVVGAWGQRQDGSVVYGLFEPVPGAAHELVAGEGQRLESLLDGEFLPQRTSTAFTRALG